MRIHETCHGKPGAEFTIRWRWNPETDIAKGRVQFLAPRVTRDRMTGRKPNALFRCTIEVHPSGRVEVMKQARAKGGRRYQTFYDQTEAVESINRWIRRNFAIVEDD